MGSFESLGCWLTGDIVAGAVHEKRAFSDGNSRPLKTNSECFQPDFRVACSGRPYGIRGAIIDE
jgi:hypothetical protein